MATVGVKGLKGSELS